MRYKMDRQQLRHDEITANRRIQEHETVTNLFRVFSKKAEVPADESKSQGSATATQVLSGRQSSRA
jgi:hypothetical protein